MATSKRAASPAFEVGQRVRATNRYEGGPPVGALGIVRVTGGRESTKGAGPLVGVEWDACEGWAGHSLDGRCAARRGWWMPATMLGVVDTVGQARQHAELGVVTVVSNPYMEPSTNRLLVVLQDGAGNLWLRAESEAHDEA